MTIRSMTETIGPCGDAAQRPDIHVRRVDTPEGPQVEIAILSSLYCWRVRSWWTPEDAIAIANRILIAGQGDT